MVAPARLRAFASALTGRLVLPGDAAYADTRPRRSRFPRQWLPLAVARCATPADVALSVRFAAEHGLPLAVRGGGHGFADQSSTDGLLVDLGPMDSVTVSGDTVAVGPGVRIGALAARLAPLESVVPNGWCPTVGVTGAALGGGYGVHGRHYGLACDHVVAADVVLADGSTVRASGRSHPDLLWALRGAGSARPGIVTSLELRTRKALPTTTFALMWPYEQAAAVVDAWQHAAPSAPDTVNAELVLVMGADPGTIPLAVLFGAVVPADPTAAVDAAADVDPDLWLDGVARAVGVPPWRRFVTALTGREAADHHVYGGAPASTEPVTGVPAGARPAHRVLRSNFFDHPLPAAAIGALVDSVVADRVAGQYREVEFVPWGGAYARVPVQDTAFAHREPLFLVEHNCDVGASATDQERAAVDAWVTRSWSTLRPHATGAVYPNYPDPDLPDAPTAYHGPNLPRLARVRATYDPHDLLGRPHSR